MLKVKLIRFLWGLVVCLLITGLPVAGPPAQAAPAAATSPYPKSPLITGISFDWSTHIRLAIGSDNWPLTWADDGHQYTSWGDGGGFGGSNTDGRVSLGFGRVEGDKSSYQGFNIWGGKNAPHPAAFDGKSRGLLSLDGVLYMWRCGDGSQDAAFRFQRLYRSTNHAASWSETGVEFTQASFGATKGFFCPTFLQFGKNYQGARDSYVYIYAPEIKSLTWDVQKPGEIALLRVPRTALSDRSQYEFFAGLDGSGSPTWTKDLTRRKPVFSDPANGVMRTTVNYNPGLQRYFLLTEHTARSQGNLGIYDAPTPWGPWTTVLFQSGWGLPNIDPTTFFWVFSNKWTSADGKDTVMVFTGSNKNDAWNSVEVHFSVGGDPPPTEEPTGQPPPTATPPPQPTATPPPAAVNLKINFQPSRSSIPSGHLPDYGAIFGSQGSGYSYGWNVDNTANARDRNSELSPSEAYDTFNHLQREGTFTWEVALPAGSYLVRIVAGDANFADSVYHLEAEGQTVVNASPQNQAHWVEGTASISVTDGRLTVSSGSQAFNNKINLIEITSLDVSGSPQQFIYLAHILQSR